MAVFGYDGIERFAGCVLDTYEHNGSWDSDFYAVVWDEEQQAIRSIEYATTRACTDDCWAKVDATPDVIEKAKAYMKSFIFDCLKGKAAKQALIPGVGKNVEVVGGRKHKGKIGVAFWKGVDQYKSSRWWTVYSLGVKADDGTKFFVPEDYLRVTDPEDWIDSLDEIRAEANRLARNPFYALFNAGFLMSI